MSETFVGYVVSAGSYLLKEPQEYQGKVNTHRLAMKVKGDLLGGIPDDTYIGFGNTTQDSFIVKGKDEKWRVVGEGSKVTITYDKSVGSNGVTYYNSGKSKLVVNDLVEGKKWEAEAPAAAPANNQRNAAPAKQFNKVGIQTGHAMNCGIDYMVAHNIEFSIENLKGYALDFHDLTEQIKATHASNNPKLSEYDASASSGMAIKAAASIASCFEEISEIAFAILNDVSPEIEEYIRNGGNSAEEPTPAKEEKKPAAKPSVRKAAPAVPRKLEDTPQAEKPKPRAKATPKVVDDFDDDIPF